MLAIAVHEYNNVTGCDTNPALNRRSIANIVGVNKDGSTGCLGGMGRIVGRAVIDYNDFGVGVGAPQGTDQITDALGLVVGWDYNGKLEGVHILIQP
jgi:hypothetical protein